MHYAGAISGTFSISERFFEYFNVAYKWNKFYNEAFVGHACQTMRFFVVAVCKGQIVDFVATAADAFSEGDVCVLDQPVEFFVVELVFLIKSTDISVIDDPNALIDGFFDAVFWRPATTSGIEYTESKNEAESET